MKHFKGEPKRCLNESNERILEAMKIRTQGRRKRQLYTKIR